MLERLPPDVTIYEVGPRDGLQNESRLIPTASKVQLINALSGTGLRAIEVTSFVNPKWIPQLADAAEVARQIERVPGVTYSALVPNHKGLESAIAVQMPEIAVFLSASETHNKKNVNKTIDETLMAFRETIPPALAHGMRVRAYVSTVYGCPYEGAVDPNKAVQLCRELRALGCYQISLGDTIGVANPKQTRDVLARVLAEHPADAVAVHFHDTRGTALANILVAVEMGITTVDSALGGLGGCPYAPGASGNVATEDVIYMLEGMGINTGVNLDGLVACSELATSLIGHDVPSKYYRAAIGARQRSRRHSSG
ncbi:MAG: hydroxymethylglutaryl-CoA lyase [Deltaproteobacteria bacterium]|nr:hydroxymethylglutaryl-CoA lyase [Deltaproteobacteria bacterium]